MAFAISQVCIAFMSDVDLVHELAPPWLIGDIRWDSWEAWSPVKQQIRSSKSYLMSKPFISYLTNDHISTFIVAHGIYSRCNFSKKLMSKATCTICNLCEIWRKLNWGEKTYSSGRATYFLTTIFSLHLCRKMCNFLPFLTWIESHWFDENLYRFCADY